MAKQWWLLTLRRESQRVCSNYRGITLLCLNDEVYANMTEIRVHLLVKPPIQEGNAVVTPVVEHWTNFILLRMFEGAWEFT